MKIPMRIRILAAIVMGGVVVASSACGVDSTSPVPVQPSATPERVARLGPTEAEKALVGVADGTYRVLFDPTKDQVFALGPNRLEIPANAVCALGTSNYGPAYWNSPCAAETRPIRLTVTVKDANSDHPSVDFQPAMRFSPSKTESLYFYVPKVSRADARNWLILYCPPSGSGSGKCVNEAEFDNDLRTYIDYDASVLFRRIKHFSLYSVDGRSGYVVGE
jgi:hypothetical protein